MKDVFPGYSQVAAPAADDARLKWEMIHARVVPPDAPLKGVGLDWGPIQARGQEINRTIRYVPDFGDSWQTPSQTLARGAGDCEDYAILKYAALAASGLPESCLCVVLCEIARMPQNEQHAFLVVDLDGERRVLDNKFDQLIQPAYYLEVNMRPIKGLSGSDVFVFSRMFTMADKMGEAG